LQNFVSSNLILSYTQISFCLRKNSLYFSYFYLLELFMKKFI